jgi:nitrate/nitrite transport system permease protein
MKALFYKYKLGTKLMSFGLLVLLLFVWHLSTTAGAFSADGKTDDEIMLMEMNGEIIPDPDNEGQYINNPDKVATFPGPMRVVEKIYAEFSNPFHRKGTNDHGIGWLILYTLGVFAIGYIAASLCGILLGVLIGLSRTLFEVLNPFLQVLKPISPVAWMPLLLYTVQDGKWVAILVVFLASLWPTVANTAFGVSNIREDYLRVASLLQFSWFRRFFTVILPGAAPAIVSGLRISFVSALVAIVPAEMLLGELGVGYNIWMEWNNLDIAGVIFAVLVFGAMGFILDSLLDRFAKGVSFVE